MQTLGEGSKGSDADDRQRPLLVMDTQGMDGDVGKDSVDRPERLRKTSGFPESLPAALFVNSHQSIWEIAARARAGIPADVARYAKEMNVVMVRTIDLFMLMRELENNPRRKDRLTQLLLSGGGWLEADGEKHRLHG